MEDVDEIDRNLYLKQIRKFTGCRKVTSQFHDFKLIWLVPFLCLTMGFSRWIHDKYHKRMWIEFAMLLWHMLVLAFLIIVTSEIYHRL